MLVYALNFLSPMCNHTISCSSPHSTALPSLGLVPIAAPHPATLACRTVGSGVHAPCSYEQTNELCRWLVGTGCRAS